MTEERKPPTVDPTAVEADLAAIARDETLLERDIEQLEKDLRTKHKHVDITVNRQPVRLTDERVSGAQIKQAAIQQGVQIDLGFQLWQELKGGHERQIGDADEVTVHEGAHFTAIAPDDNS